MRIYIAWFEEGPRWRTRQSKRLSPLSSWVPIPHGYLHPGSLEHSEMQSCPPF